MGKTALPGASRTTAFTLDPDQVVIIGLDTKDGIEHPLYDERVKMPLDEGLVRNIMIHGILQAISVRKNGDTIEVIAGRQRVRSAREANKRLKAKGLAPIKVPAFVRRDRDGDVIGIMISENENRTDDNPIVRAQKAQRMLNLGHTEGAAAAAFGISVQQLKNLLQVLDLADGVQDMVSKGNLSFTAATQIADLPREDQVVQAKAMIEAGTGVVEAKRQRRMRKAKKNGKAAPTDPTASLRGKSVKVSVLRSIAADEEFMSTLEPQARDMLKWIIGDEGAAKRIKGLTAQLKS